MVKNLFIINMVEDRPKKSGALEDLLSKFPSRFFAEVQVMALYFADVEQFERFSDNFQKNLKNVDREVFSC